MHEMPILHLGTVLTVLSILAVVVSLLVGLVRSDLRANPPMPRKHDDGEAA